MTLANSIWERLTNVLECLQVQLALAPSELAPSDTGLRLTHVSANLVGHTIERVGENVRTFLPFYKPQNKIHGNAEKKIQPVKLAPKLNEDMRSASTKALAKINEALRKSAEIVAESIKDNTVKVIQYK